MSYDFYGQLPPPQGCLRVVCVLGWALCENKAQIGHDYWYWVSLVDMRIPPQPHQTVAQPLNTRLGGRGSLRLWLWLWRFTAVLSKHARRSGACISCAACANCGSAPLSLSPFLSLSLSLSRLSGDRCAAKAGRTVQSVQVLLPEEDFPSPDGRHPLKVAIVRV